MEPNKIAAEINRLSLPQKLILAQDIWDSIALEGNNLPMPEWQKRELKKKVWAVSTGPGGLASIGGKFTTSYVKNINETALYRQSQRRS